MSEKRIYKALRRHLDRQPVGYPRTISNDDIRLLKWFFNPDEAQLAMKLDYKPRTIEQIYKSLDNKELTRKELEEKLDRMMKNGAIGYIEKEGEGYYCNIPLVVGMYEMQLPKLSPEFLRDFEKYTSKISFGLEILGTEIPQMRTIPVERSIRPEHHVADYDQVVKLIEESESQPVVIECICRKAAHMRGEKCKQTTRMETCMALGNAAKNTIIAGIGRVVSKDEAIEYLRKNEADGLVFQPSNTRKAEFICSCCGCCCGMLRIQKMLPRPVDFWSVNYQAAVDKELCTGCMTCEERCQVNAVAVDEKENVASVDLYRCIGCGNCVASCPSNAISLFKKEKENTPPETLEDLYDIIMENKKTVFDRVKLATRLILKR